jgi:membrane protease YdiL (CAAX protease family)
VQIYQQNQNGNGPQYHYGNPTSGSIINNSYMQEQEEKKKKESNKNSTFRTLGLFAGLGLLACLVLSTVMSFVAVIFPSILEDTGSYLLFNIFYQVLVIGGTFLGLFFILKTPKDALTGERRYKPHIDFALPKKGLKTFLLILIGFGGCMVANYIVSIIFTFLEETFGITSGYTSDMVINNPLEAVVLVIGIAVIPPLIEEFAMRGVLLSSMKRYGTTFAIFASAFIFGLFHGNLVQIPFAFICGLFFAYITLATKSIWPAVIVHALNNGLSCSGNILEYYFKNNLDKANKTIPAYSDILAWITEKSPKIADSLIEFFGKELTVETLSYFILAYIVPAVIVLIGIIALIIYLVKFKKERILKDNGLIPEYAPANKFRLFMSAPTMIIATIIYSLEAVSLVLMSSPEIMEILEGFLGQSSGGGFSQFT